MCAINNKIKVHNAKNVYFSTYLVLWRVHAKSSGISFYVELHFRHGSLATCSTRLGYFIRLANTQLLHDSSNANFFIFIFCSRKDFRCVTIVVKRKTNVFSLADTFHFHSHFICNACGYNCHESDIQRKMAFVLLSSSNSISSGRKSLSP